MAATGGYERRIGRYGAALADALIDVARVREGHEALDVGCGNGALTERTRPSTGAHGVTCARGCSSGSAARRGRSR
jgi:cyclopropane fatty-acyl-phospholipid synthase-like methyltransferase